MLDPGSMVLVVIDMQNVFCHREGALARSGSTVTHQESIVGKVRTLVSLCRSHKIPVIWTQQFQLASKRARQKGVTSDIRGSWDWDVVEELKSEMSPEDHILHKPRWSIFYRTEGEPLLADLKAKILIISGINSEVCIDLAIREAAQRDFEVILVSDCVGGSDIDLHKAVLEMAQRYFARVMTLEELSRLLRSSLR